MVSTEKISELLFEFSNPSRLDILMLIREKSIKPSQLARAADQTIQETSRHLQRLTKAMLVERNSDGAYSLTPFGKQLLALMPEIHFLAINSEYFTTHDPSCLPPEFRYGLGLIQEYNKASHVMEAFQQSEDLIRNSEEIIWILSDQILASTLPLIGEAIQRGVDFRVILPKKIGSQGPHLEHYPNFMGRHSQTQERFIESVQLVLVMSEKKALLSFPTKDGCPDYLGFALTNEAGLKWCKELYLYYWNQSES
ncbi:MAG: helix-turn-helix domain-containing protein [Candidatus Thorarchaeota archaeon]|nr:helix-turn-helix domain-containing protein [Candidatus Thorarchaeota archaeon]